MNDSGNQGYCDAYKMYGTRLALFFIYWNTTQNHMQVSYSSQVLTKSAGELWKQMNEVWHTYNNVSQDELTYMYK